MDYSTDPGALAAATTLEGRYTAMQTKREPFLRRARLASSLSLTTLVPPQGHTATQDLPVPFQSIGARGSNNLAAKLLLALFPPNAPFFKFKIDPYALEQIRGLAEGAEDEIQKNLLKAEEAVQGEIETRAYRPYLHEAAKHLVVAGNCLFYMGEGDPGARGSRRPRVFHLPSYVVRRCNDVVECVITVEEVDRDDLPASLRQRAAGDPAHRDDAAPVRLYTGCERDQSTGKWTVWQEALGLEVPDTRATYAADTFPYVVLRGEVVSGEDYGRSHVDGYIGDLQSLEGLSQAIVEASAAAAAGRFMVNPNGVTDERDVSDKPNWSFCAGRAEDITVLQLGKYADMQVAGNTAKGIEERLAYAFLLNTAIQRNAERVTAEEVRYMAQELEQGLGGLYSLLSHEFQLPFVTVLVARMTAERRLPELPPRIVRPSIVTGIEALGRGNDLSRLSQGFAVLRGILGDSVASVVKAAPTALRVMNAAGVRAEDLIKTSEEVAAEQQAAQQQALAERAAPQAVSAMAGMMAPAQPNA